MNLKQNNEAIKYFDFALQLNPKYNNALDGKFKSLMNLGQYKQGLDIIDLIIRLEPKRLDA